jgi:5-methylcytosine-specific restriction endonuclease McrA
MTTPDNKAVALFKASDLELEFPEPKDFVPRKIAMATQQTIISKGSYTLDGKAYVEKSAIPHLLGTDKAGANQFYNDLANSEKMQSGQDRFVHTAAVMGEISRRIQEPIPANKQENLKYREDCLRTFRDHPELERRRAVHEGHIREALAGLKERMIRAEGVTHCQVSGEPLDPTAHVHHIVRRADNPSLSLDPRNLALTNPNAHQEIHRAEAHSPEKLEVLAKEQGWPWRADGTE